MTKTSTTLSISRDAIAVFSPLSSDGQRSTTACVVAIVPDTAAVYLSTVRDNFYAWEQELLSTRTGRLLLLGTLKPGMTVSGCSTISVNPRYAARLVTRGVSTVSSTSGAVSSLGLPAEHTAEGPPLVLDVPRRRCIDNSKASIALQTGQSVAAARILNTNLFEMSLVAATSSSLLTEPYLVANDLRPGQIIPNAEVAGTFDGFILVKVSNYVSIRIPQDQLSDVPLKQLPTRFRVGEKLKCRILFVQQDKGRATGTAKKTFIELADPILGWDGCVVGRVSTSYVSTPTERLDQDICVRFFGDARATIPHSEFIKFKKTGLLKQGSLVQCRIKSCNLLARRVVCTLDLNSADDDDSQPAPDNFGAGTGAIASLLLSSLGRLGNRASSDGSCCCSLDKFIAALSANDTFEFETAASAASVDFLRHQLEKLVELAGLSTGTATVDLNLLGSLEIGQLLDSGVIVDWLAEVDYWAVLAAVGGSDAAPERRHGTNKNCVSLRLVFVPSGHVGESPEESRRWNECARRALENRTRSSTEYNALALPPRLVVLQPCGIISSTLTTATAAGAPAAALEDRKVRFPVCIASGKRRLVDAATAGRFVSTYEQLMAAFCRREILQGYVKQALTGGLRVSAGSYAIEGFVPVAFCLPPVQLLADANPSDFDPALPQQQADQSLLERFSSGSYVAFRVYDLNNNASWEAGKHRSDFVADIRSPTQSRRVASRTAVVERQPPLSHRTTIGDADARALIKFDMLREGHIVAAEVWKTIETGLILRLEQSNNSCTAFCGVRYISDIPEAELKNPRSLALREAQALKQYARGDRVAAIITRVDPQKRHILVTLRASAFSHLQQIETIQDKLIARQQRQREAALAHEQAPQPLGQPREEAEDQTTGAGEAEGGTANESDGEAESEQHRHDDDDEPEEETSEGHQQLEVVHDEREQVEMGRGLETASEKKNLLLSSGNGIERTPKKMKKIKNQMKSQQEQSDDTNPRLSNKSGTRASLQNIENSTDSSEDDTIKSGWPDGGAEPDDDVGLDQRGRRVVQKQKRETAAARRRREIRIRAAEAEDAAQPGLVAQTADDFDRLLFSNRDSAAIWIRYMAHHLQFRELEKARSTAERALKTIAPEMEQERLNVWIALLNLEAQHGTPASLKAVVARAQQYMGPRPILFHLISVYEQQGCFTEALKTAELAAKKFPRSKKMWIKWIQLLVAAAGSAGQHKSINNNPAAADVNQFDPAGYLTTASDYFDRVAKVVSQALAHLPKHKQAALISTAARLEFKHGSIERGRSHFEQFLAEYPRRGDVWNQYFDCLTNACKAKKRELPADAVRATFEKVVDASRLKPRQIKAVFTRWLAFERDLGNSCGMTSVQQKAREYVERIPVTA